MTTTNKIDIYSSVSDATLNFLENSKNNEYDKNSVDSGQLSLSMQSDAIKYSKRYNPVKIDLTIDENTAADSLYQLNRDRRSKREFGKEHVSLSEMAQILCRSYFLNEREPYKFNTPSAGGLYPIEIYIY